MAQFVRICDEFWVFNLSQEKEYRDALEFFNEKKREKVQLITRLMEVSLLNNCLLGLSCNFMDGWNPNQSGQFGVRVSRVEPALTNYQPYKIWAYLWLGVQPVQTLNRC